MLLNPFTESDSVKQQRAYFESLQEKVDVGNANAKHELADLRGFFKYFYRIMYEAELYAYRHNDEYPFPPFDMSHIFATPSDFALLRPALRVLPEFKSLSKQGFEAHYVIQSFGMFWNKFDAGDIDAAANSLAAIEYVYAA